MRMFFTSAYGHSAETIKVGRAERCDERADKVSRDLRYAQMYNLLSRFCNDRGIDKDLEIQQEMLQQKLYKFRSWGKIKSS